MNTVIQHTRTPTRRDPCALKRPGKAPSTPQTIASRLPSSSQAPTTRPTQHPTTLSPLACPGRQH